MYRRTAYDEIEINGKKIKFPCSISTYSNDRLRPFIVEINRLVVVNFVPFTLAESENLKTIEDLDMERNIWAFDQQANLVWKVMPSYTALKWPLPPNREQDPYYGVYMKEGKLVGSTWLCGEYEINPADGTVKFFYDVPQRPW